jgi:tripartite-type tricarboxylate transporter receptor subunit TctC
LVAAAKANPAAINLAGLAQRQAAAGLGLKWFFIHHKYAARLPHWISPGRLRDLMGRIQKLWALVAGLATAVSIGNAALADKWLSHPISVVSAFATGTTSDTVAQTVLGPAGAQLGQPFVLENRPGHGGTAAVASVVKAAPDGYTLLLATSAMTAAVILHKSLPYDTVRDLASVAMFAVEPAC